MKGTDSPEVEKYSAKCVEEDVTPVKKPSRKRKILLKLFKGNTVVRGRWQAFPQFESDLANWVRRSHYEGNKLLRNQDIRREALNLAQKKFKIPAEYFKASLNWLHSFVKRHNLQPYKLPAHAKKSQDKPAVPPELKIRLTDINIYITCGICQGYLCNACTITECMHSFCKSCIVKHVERRLYCPVCDDEIHPTDPLVNIRQDPLLQDVVDRLLPNVKEDERERERLFWEKHKEEHPELYVVKQEPDDSHQELEESNLDETPDTSHEYSVEESVVSGSTNNSNSHIEEKVPTKLVSLCLECIGQILHREVHPISHQFMNIDEKSGKLQCFELAKKPHFICPEDRLFGDLSCHKVIPYFRGISHRNASSTALLLSDLIISDQVLVVCSQFFLTRLLKLEALEKKFVRVMGSATVENLCAFLRFKLRLTKKTTIKIFVNARKIDVSSCSLIWLRENYFHGQDLIMPLQYRITSG